MLSMQCIIEVNIINAKLQLDIKGKEFEVIKEDSISNFEMARIEYSTHIGNIAIGTREEIVKHLEKFGFKKFRIFKHNEGVYDLMTHRTIDAVK